VEEVVARPAPLDVELRPAREGDAEALAAIYNEAVRSTVATLDTEPRSLELQRAWLREHGERHPVLVAERSGDVIGWAALSRWSERRGYDGTAEVSVYVRSDHRGRGVGGRLLAALVGSARELHLHALLARIADGNAASVRVHTVLGFRPVGVMKEVGSKFGRWVDVHLYELVLG
jgi:L-amino acid N-acyltransferase YncA